VRGSKADGSSCSARFTAFRLTLNP
jgi:hypothetical protein